MLKYYIDMEGCRIKEPLKGYELQIVMLETSSIEIPEIERDLSEQHVKKLVYSIERVGFVEPIIVIEEGGKFLVINGQHRLEAAKILGIEKIPAIVLPSHIKDFIIALNTEKAPTLRDKSHQAYVIFKEYLSKNPKLEEIELQGKVEEPYYITVGFIIDEFGERRFPGYAFERLLKKVDEFLTSPLEEAVEERRNRAKVLMEVKEVLNQRYEELGLKNALQKEAIVAKAVQAVYGKRVREIPDDFYTAFEKVKEEIPRVSISEEETGF